MIFFWFVFELNLSRIKVIRCPFRLFCFDLPNLSRANVYFVTNYFQYDVTHVWRSNFFSFWYTKNFIAAIERRKNALSQEGHEFEQRGCPGRDFCLSIYGILNSLKSGKISINSKISKIFKRISIDTTIDHIIEYYQFFQIMHFDFWLSFRKKSKRALSDPWFWPRKHVRQASNRKSRFFSKIKIWTN